MADWATAVVSRSIAGSVEVTTVEAAVPLVMIS